MDKENKTFFSKLSKPQALGSVGLIVIILLGAFLRFYQLGSDSLGNEYYAATVKSMLLSWHNFFFVAFEPFGSVSVDKPPLGFWVEALSAYILGFNGFALAFPNALAGVLSIPITYLLVKKQFGLLPALFSALSLAVTPITVATERNNTIDGLLVFVLLLATWATWKAASDSKARYLLLGFSLVGLGFNIKMLQALMILPALCVLYFFGSKSSLMKKLLALTLATSFLAVISLSWALVIDAVPPANRPFIGSSTNNSVLELIVGHNGLKRLSSGPGPGGPDGISPTKANSSLNTQPHPLIGGWGLKPPDRQSFLPLPNRQVPGPSRVSEVGESGPLRLVTEPLASQNFWLAPLIFCGTACAYLLWRNRLSRDQSLGLMLWICWLLPMLLYFSFTGGLWHTYYLIMTGPATAALFGISFWVFSQMLSAPNTILLGKLSKQLVISLSGLTVLFEIFILSVYPAYFLTGCLLITIPWLITALILWVHPGKLSLSMIFISLLLGPLFWSGLTTFNSKPDVNLPKAGPAFGQTDNRSASGYIGFTPQKVLDYLLENTNPDSYLAATVDSHGASPLILATGRAVLTFGGFNGVDNAISTIQLADLVSSGKLRFILDNDTLSDKSEIYNWVISECKTVSIPGVLVTNKSENIPKEAGPRDQQFTALFDCSIK